MADCYFTGTERYMNDLFPVMTMSQKRLQVLRTSSINFYIWLCECYILWC